MENETVTNVTEFDSAQAEAIGAYEAAEAAEAASAETTEAAPKPKRARKPKAEVAPEVPAEIILDEDGNQLDPATGEVIQPDAPEPAAESPRYEMDYSDQGEFDGIDWENLEYHSFANLYPMMSEDELVALGEDIAMNGQIEEIVLVRDTSDNDKIKVLDGRNRHQGMLRLDIRPRFRWGRTESLFADTISLNLRRRQMNASQKACLGSKLRVLIDEQRRAGALEGTPADTGDSRDIVGIIVGCTGRYIDMAGELFRKAPDLFEQVETGSMALTQAMRTLGDRNETEAREESNGGTDPQGDGADVGPTLVAVPFAELTSLTERVVSSGSKVVSRRMLLTLLKMLAHYVKKYGLEVPRGVQMPEAAAAAASKAAAKAAAASSKKKTAK